MRDVYSIIKADHTRGYPWGGTTGEARNAPASMGSDEECRHAYLGDRISKPDIVNPRKDDIIKRIKSIKKIYGKVRELLCIISEETFNIDETLRVLYKTGCGYARLNKKSVDEIIKMFEGLQPEMMWENEQVKEILYYYKLENQAKKNDVKVCSYHFNKRKRRSKIYNSHNISIAIAKNLKKEDRERLKKNFSALR